MAALSRLQLELELKRQRDRDKEIQEKERVRQHVLTLKQEMLQRFLKKHNLTAIMCTDTSCTVEGIDVCAEKVRDSEGGDFYFLRFQKGLKTSALGQDALEDPIKVAEAFEFVQKP